jgi:hypothetical protein
MEAAPSVDHRNLTSDHSTVLLVACLCDTPPFCREIRLMERGADKLHRTAPGSLEALSSDEVERPATAASEGARTWWLFLRPKIGVVPFISMALVLRVLQSSTGSSVAPRRCGFLRSPWASSRT